MGLWAEEEFYADPRGFRDCRFLDEDRGWDVPARLYAQFEDLGLPLCTVSGVGPAVLDTEDVTGVAMVQTWLNRQADSTLKAAHARLGKTGTMRDNQNHLVGSLDYVEDAIAGPDLVLDDPTVREDVSGLLADLYELCGLSHSEMAVVQAVVEGANQGTYGWSDAVAARLDTTPNNVRVIWSRAKKKIKATWAIEPKERDVPKLRHSIEGSGPYCGGEDRSWSRAIDPTEAKDAMIRYECREETPGVRDDDWTYSYSLTEDGYQLGDDELWATLL